jgi:putative hemolysin
MKIRNIAIVVVAAAMLLATTAISTSALPNSSRTRRTGMAVY